MPALSLRRRAWWTTQDYLKRLWDNSGDDEIFFMAGAIAFRNAYAAF